MNTINVYQGIIKTLIKIEYQNNNKITKGKRFKKTILYKNNNQYIDLRSYKKYFGIEHAKNVNDKYVDENTLISIKELYDVRNYYQNGRDLLKSLKK